MELTIEAINIIPLFGMGIVLGLFSLLYLSTLIEYLRYNLGLPLAIALILSISGSLFLLPPLGGSVVSALQTNPQRDQFLEGLGKRIGADVAGDKELDGLFHSPREVWDISEPMELSYVLNGKPQELIIVAKRVNQVGDRYSFELYLEPAEGRGFVAFDPRSLGSSQTPNG